MLLNSNITLIFTSGLSIFKELTNQSDETHS